jgi:hypothetical protein
MTEANAAESRRRGSDVLLENYQRGGFQLEPEVMNQFAELFAEVEAQDVLVKGQPHPDLLRATFRFEDPDQCGTTVGRVLNLIGKNGVGKVPAGIRVFPKGIPWPEYYVLDVVIGEQHSG